MQIRVKCPNGHAIKANEGYRGKKVKCPKCNAPTLIEDEEIYSLVPLTDVEVAAQERNDLSNISEFSDSSKPLSDDLWTDGCYQASPLQTPYALPPQQNGVTIGVWRDGKKMVMDVRNRRFPKRCVKTNEPYDGIDREIDVTYITGGPMFIVSTLLSFVAIFLVVNLGGTARVMFWFYTIEDLKICLPIHKDWLKKHEKRRTFGFFTLTMTLIGAMALFFLYFACLFFGVTDAQSIWLFYLVLLMLAASCVAAINVLRLGGPVAVVTKKTLTHFWIAGLHPEFICELPEWKN